MEGFRSGFVTLVGAPNVGKSTLMNQILKEKISITCPKPQTTRNRVLGILNQSGYQTVFLDTPGIHQARDQFNKILVETALATLRDVDVVCFLIEAPQAHDDINRFILETLERLNTPVLLVINKIDLIAKSTLLPIIDDYRKRREFHCIMPISALLNEGIEDLVDQIAGLLPEGPQYYPPDLVTDQPERFLVAELIREKVFLLTHQEVPYAAAVTIDTFSEAPERRQIHIEATIHVERNSQKGIIIGKKGRMLKEIGTQARQDIERLLGCHVFLGLFVRVQKKWRKDLRIAAEFGYQRPR